MFSIKEPSYGRRTVMLASAKVIPRMNTVVIAMGAYKGTYVVSAEAIRNSPTVSLKTKQGYAMPMFDVALSELEKVSD